MRIISGFHKGRKIVAPKNLPIRPTTDMSKESIFNIFLNEYNFNDISVVDLYSGSGNISFEFASRGVTKITSVENNINCIKFIKKISNELDLNLNVIKSDVIGFLKKTDIKSDIIFADPPYDFDEEYLKNIVELTFSNELINEGGSLVIEHSKQVSLNEVEYFVSKRNYGSCFFSFFQKKRVLL
jgi:16S rRNA (guanine966-N2)-methyltransferase